MKATDLKGKMIRNVSKETKKGRGVILGNEQEIVIMKDKNLWELNNRKEREEVLKERVGGEEFEKIFGKRYKGNQSVSQISYDITHPEPFNFGKHTAPYSNKNKYLEYLQSVEHEKHAKEMIQVKAKGIPKSTYEPRYEKIVEHETMRKVKNAEYKHHIRAFKDEQKMMGTMKEQNADASERYGKFDDILNLSTNKFRAKPIPKSNQPGLYQEMEDQRKYEKANYHRAHEDIEERKKLKKKGRIDQNNLWYVPAKMRMEELQRLESKKQNEKDVRRELDRECTFHPMISKNTFVDDLAHYFMVKHKKNQDELDFKKHTVKRKQQLSVPETFFFETEQRAKKTKQNNWLDKENSVARARKLQEIDEADEWNMGKQGKSRHIETDKCGAMGSQYKSMSNIKSKELWKQPPKITPKGTAKYYDKLTKAQEIKYINYQKKQFEKMQKDARLKSQEFLKGRIHQNPQIMAAEQDRKLRMDNHSRHNQDYMKGQQMEYQMMKKQMYNRIYTGSLMMEQSTPGQSQISRNSA